MKKGHLAILLAVAAVGLYPPWLGTPYPFVSKPLYPMGHGWVFRPPLYVTPKPGAQELENRGIDTSQFALEWGMAAAITAALVIWLAGVGKPKPRE